MRILHTSDWHLGRSFGPLSLERDQQAFLDWLVALCAEARVDLLVVAGDIYDRAVAPTEAVVLFRETLRRLLDRRVQIAVITGNHDSAERVAAYDDLLDVSGVYLRGGYARCGEVATLEVEDGPLDLVLLPFLDPQAAPDELPEAVASADDDLVQRRLRRTHQSVLHSAVETARASLSGARSLAVGHAFVAGGIESESERRLTVGGAGQVDAAVFAGFSYVALGHLHRPQAVTETVRYSGSPLAYSFSEEHGKSVVLVDMAPDGSVAVETVAVPIGRPVRTIRGTMEQLLSATASSVPADAFVRAVVTDRETVLDAKAKLAVSYPYIVEVRLEPEGVVDSPSEAAVEIREMTPLEATRRFWAAAEGSDPDGATDSLLVEFVSVASAEPA